MEVFDFIAVMSVLGVVSGVGIALIYRVIPRKTTKRVAEDSLTRLLRANSTLTEEYEERQKMMHKSLQQENIRLRKQLDDTPEEEKEGLSFDQIKALAQSQGINPILLEIPQVKSLVQDFTKGKSAEEITSTLQGLLQLYKQQGGGGQSGSQDSGFGEFTDQQKQYPTV